MLRLRNVLLSASACAALSAGAQDAPVELDPVTVSSSLSPVAASKTGRNILVIRGEEISKLPVHSLDELLRYVPGLEVQARGPMGAQSDLVLRGSTFQQVLVVLDGLRLNDPNTGHFSSYIPVAPSEIERIEVLKGASSAIYGSDAVGGVIHIITKTFARKTARKELSIQQTTGEYGLQNISAGGFYSNGKTAVSAGVLSNNTNGQPQRGTRGFLNNHTASVAASHQLSDSWQLAWRSAYDHRNFSAQNFYTLSAADTATEKVQSLWNQLRAAYQKGRNSFSLQAGYKKVDDRYQFNRVTAANRNRSELWQALAVYSHQFGEQTTLTGGAQFLDRAIRSNDRGDHSDQTAGAFVQLHQRIGSALNISPALRLDGHEGTGAQLVPQLNASYQLAKVLFRASAGRTIRYADFTEQYNNYNKPPYLAPGTRVGNPGLEAERSTSYEAGADWTPLEGLKVATTVFRRENDGLIDYVLTRYAQMPRKENLRDTTYLLAKNVYELTVTGWETDVHYHRNYANGRQLFASCGLVWMDAQTTETNPSLYILSAAKFLTNFTVRYSLPCGSLSVNGLYKKRARIAGATFLTPLSGDYFVLNLKAETFLLKDKVSLFGEADNLLDRHYTDLLGARMPGRWLMGGLKVSL
ncbi:TonB-dependent receptor [Paraflavisolibacter sp. H34]|uniref:TonB-dependent receptor plug domain-containing protein n=1 Tax=Huijunlia imazamoxiresistens TaxID=3127457 RepID=UPI0030177C14